MSRFIDQEEVRKEAKRRLALRRGDMTPPERQEARERLEARKASKAEQGNPDDSTQAHSGDLGADTAPEDGKVLPWKSVFGTISCRLRSASPHTLVFLAVALLLVLLALGAGIVMRTDMLAKSEVVQEELGTTTTQPPASDVDKGVVEVEVPDYIDQETADGLKAQAQQNPTVARIAAHIDDYGRFGEENRRKLLSLVLEEPDAIPFVDRLLSYYPDDANEPYSDPEWETGIPHLYQWDLRWGLKEYSAAPFGLTGCCPTSLSMVYMGLTGKTDMTPGVLADLAREHGYMSEMNGTIGDFLINESPSLGLVCFESSVDASTLLAGLADGYVYICNVGEGEFTEGGHFFVITGQTGDGSLVINDPYSSVRSEATWDIDMVISQTIALYAFKTA